MVSQRLSLSPSTALPLFCFPPRWLHSVVTQGFYHIGIEMPVEREALFLNNLHARSTHYDEGNSVLIVQSWAVFLSLGIETENAEVTSQIMMTLPREREMDAGHLRNVCPKCIDLICEKD